MFLKNLQNYKNLRVKEQKIYRLQLNKYKEKNIKSLIEKICFRNFKFLDHMCNYFDENMCKKVKQFTSGDWRSRTKEGDVF